MRRNGNLIQFNQMPVDQHRELSARGGRASGEARRRKSVLRATVKEALEIQAIVSGHLDDLKGFGAWKKRRNKRAQTKKKSIFNWD